MRIPVHLIVFFLCITYSIHWPLSPCPQYFSYRKKSDVWTGRLIVNITGLQLPIHVRMEFGLRAVLKTKYVGLIELSEPAENVVRKIAEDDMREVTYIIRFPLPHPLPILEAIYLQRNLICRGIPVYGEVVTSIYLEHKFPTNPKFYYGQYTPNFDFDCGRSSLKADKLTKIVGFGEWPWLTGILERDGPGFKFRCNGNLITKKHVITAGHCIRKNEIQNPGVNGLIGYFGKHNLYHWGETNSQTRQVSQIYLHPDFNRATYTADIAIVKLSSPVEINDFVSPVCIWSGRSELHHIVNRMGTIVSWGENTTNRLITPQPRIFQMPIVDQEKCLRSKISFLRITSNRTLCAGLRNGRGPCNGDSGGGLMIKSRNGKNEEVWQLRGLVSLSLINPKTLTCDHFQYQVFTDVAKFKRWIFQIIINEDEIDP